MSGSPVRMLWISIRAMQYTDRATREVVDNLNKLQVREENFAKQQAIMNIAGGIMWVALGAMITNAITGIMRTTREGSTVMNGFDRAMSNLTKSIGTAFTAVLGPVIKMLTSFLNIISKFPPWLLQGLAALILVGVALVTLKGGMMILHGVLGLLNVQFGLSKLAFLDWCVGAGMSETHATTLGVAIGFLQKNLGRIMLAFTLMSTFLSFFVKYGPAVVAAVGAITTAIIILGMAMMHLANWENVATLGIAALLAIGTMTAMSANMPSYQVGTRKVQRTGPAIVHAGEEIGGGRRNRGERINENGGSPEKQQISTTINFSGNIQTKADKEELRPLILKVIKDALDKKA